MNRFAIGRVPYRWPARAAFMVGLVAVRCGATYTPHRDIRMSPTHIYRILRWLLPLLVARALVPAGFMLSVDASGLALTFCPSVVATQAIQAHAAHGSDHTDGDARDHEHHRGHDAGTLCPFALVGGACSVDVPYVAVNVDRPSFAPVPFESASLPSIPLRAERIRGPPVVS